MLLLMAASPSFAAAPAAELFRVRDFPLSIADFEKLEPETPPPGLTSVRRKLSADKSCQLGFASFEGVDSLSITKGLGNPNMDSVNLFEFRLDGGDLVVSRFGYGYPPKETGRVEFTVEKGANGSQRLHASWSSGFRGTMADVTLTIDVDGKITHVDAEEKTLDSHMLGAMFNVLFGRNTTHVVCEFSK